MALIDTSSVNQLASTLKSAADQARSIAGGTGPLLISQIVTMQSTLQRASILTAKASEAVAANETAALLAISANGGPATSAEFSTHAAAIDTAAAAWGADVAARFTEAATALAYTVQPVTSGAVTTRMVVPPTELPAPQSDVLRASASLAAMVTAFTEIGA